MHPLLEDVRRTLGLAPVERRAVQPEAAEDPRPYYLDFSNRLEMPQGFDEAGVPLFDPVAPYARRRGTHYNPVRVQQYALACHGRWLAAGEEEYLRRFLVQADWLAGNLDEEGRWLYHFPWLDLSPPWYSGMAQGQGISVLARACLATQDPLYAEAARRALGPMTRGLAQGGVLLRREGDVWIEELAGSLLRRSVLNGHVYAMWGLWDAWRVFGEERARSLFEETEVTLRRWLPRYDFHGLWTRYCLPERGLPVLATVHYQVEHIQQMRVMYALTGREEYERWAERWERQLRRRLRATVAVLLKMVLVVLAAPGNRGYKRAILRERAAGG